MLARNFPARPGICARARSELPSPRQMRRLPPKARGQILRALERHELRTKAPGQPEGALGPRALRLAQVLLFDCLAPNGGCDPSYAALRRLTGYARATISRALDRLEATGLMQRTRRAVWLTRRVGARIKRQWTQISNAYLFQLPGEASLRCEFSPPTGSSNKRKHWLRRKEAPPPALPPIPDPGRDLLAERRAVLAAQWRAEAAQR